MSFRTNFIITGVRVKGFGIADFIETKSHQSFEIESRILVRGLVSLSKAAGKMYVASKSKETPNRSAFNGHSEVRIIKRETATGQILIGRIEILDMAIRPAYPYVCP